MRVALYAADEYGCGHHRIILVGRELQAAGHDVQIVMPSRRTVALKFDEERVVDVALTVEADVVVFQRVTHRHLAAAIPVLRSKGLAVVVDVDDDLTSIHPANAVFDRLHPRNLGRRTEDGRIHHYSWTLLSEACRDATWVTATTPSLLARYAAHGRGTVLPNYLADHYYEQVGEHEPGLFGWPASLHNHPNDPAACGNAVRRLMEDGFRFRAFGDSPGVRHAFGLSAEPEQGGAASFFEWPRLMDPLSVGICPLADTVFNGSKSWLKPLELSARGVPWVGSDRAEYRRLNALGCGFVVDKPKAWYAVVRRLLTDRAFWEDASGACSEVADSLRLSKHAWRWMEAWESAYSAR